MANRLTIYFTSDTHGYLYPSHFCDQQPRPMGLLSMRFPKDGNTLIIDGGDTIQGSPLTYYCYGHHLPLPVADALNDRQYDFVTLGNHDFNNGYGALESYLTRLNAQCLCANVTDRTGGLPLLPYAVRTMENGLRVGVIGLVTHWVTLWEKPENLTRFTLTDPVEAARPLAEKLRGQVDVLIGLYHGGLEKDLRTGERLSSTDENEGCRLCEELPFDLLLTGHQHIAMADRQYAGTHVVQTPCNAAAYVKVELEEDGTFHSQLMTPPAHAELTPSQQRLWKDVNGWLDRPIGHLSRALWPEDKLTMALESSPIAAFFNQVQLEASGADISCAALPNSLRGFDSAVTVRDVVASYVYSNTLVVLRVTGGILRQALEQCASYFDIQADGTLAVARSFLQPKEAHFNYDYFSGVEYGFDLRQPVGRRVFRLEYHGKPVQPEDSFTLCLSSYRATGAGDFPYYAQCPRVREIQTEISELILNYFTAHPYVQVEEKPAYTVIRPRKTYRKKPSGKRPEGSQLSKNSFGELSEGPRSPSDCSSPPADLRSANGPVRLRRAQHPIGRGVCAFGANSTDSFWRKKSPQASFFDKPKAFREAPGRLWLYSSRNTCRINGCAPVTGSMSICITSFMYSFHRSTTALRACT